MQQNVNAPKEGIYTIDFQGLSLDTHYFDFKVDDTLFALYDNAIVHGGSAEVAIELRKHSSMMELFVTIAGKVEVQCDRCLENFMTDVFFEGELVVRISHQQGEYDGDIMWIAPSDERLDLTQYIYESIVLSLPFQLVHPSLDQCNQDMIHRFSIVSPEEIERIEKAEANTPLEALGEMTKNK